ncbi:MAG: hypothetical protein MJE77_02210, partial [Proteobacteria bacterium]|nr:hypothetical protein [Pseudomonadota bacterium]
MTRDLTRWNRAGLRRFRYIDGNAAIYLERLRATLHQRLTEQMGVEPGWPQIEPPLDGTEAFTELELQSVDQYIRAAIASRKNQHLSAQYADKRGDVAWELMRTFARACHVLTEHVNAHANEAFLRTATQWDYVRQMVETIDYHPSGPTSASTYLVLLARPGAGGVVERGLRVRHTPPDGGPSVVFETLHDAEISHELNELRLKGSDRSPTTWRQDTGSAGKGFFAVPARLSANSGSPALLMGPGGMHAVRLQKVTADKLCIAIPDTAMGWQKGQTRLAVAPRWSRRPWLNGPHVVRTLAPHGLNPGDTVHWQEPSGDEKSATVVDSDVRAIRLAPPSPLPEAETQLYTRIKRWITEPRPGQDDAFDVIEEEVPQLRATVVAQDPQHVFPGRRPALQQGDRVVAEGPGNELHVLDIAAIGDNPNDNIFWLKFKPSQFPGTNRVDDSFDGRIDRVHADFRAIVEPIGAAINTEPVNPPGSSSAVFRLVLDHRPRLLTESRRVVIAAADGAVLPRQAIITRVDGNAITINPPLAPPEGNELGFTEGNLRIHGNVVLAGHGETRPERRLSSGPQELDDATLVLNVQNAASVQDTSFPHGARPDVEVVIDNRTWQPVPRLDQSGPTDPHYTISVTEVGHVQLGFGDGQHGRRLPAGANNVRIRHRVGAGRRGNLAAGALIELSQAHRFVDAVQQPLPARGGEDMQREDRLRDRAPSALLALDRAVSLADFESLATYRRDVWHARAFHLPGHS